MALVLIWGVVPIIWIPFFKNCQSLERCMEWTTCNVEMTLKKQFVFWIRRLMQGQESGVNNVIQLICIVTQHLTILFFFFFFFFLFFKNSCAEKCNQLCVEQKAGVCEAGCKGGREGAEKRGGGGRRWVAVVGREGLLFTSISPEKQKKEKKKKEKPEDKSPK